VKPRVSYLSRHFEQVTDSHYRCYMCRKKIHRDGLRAHMELKHHELLHRKPSGVLEVLR
jgi:hypothetical protein